MFIAPNGGLNRFFALRRGKKTVMRCPWRIHGSAPRRWRSAALPPGIGAPLDRRGPDVSTYSSFYYLLLLRLLLRLLDHP